MFEFFYGQLCCHRHGWSKGEMHVAVCWGVWDQIFVGWGGRNRPWKCRHIIFHSFI